jgi:hypothetical protein
MVALHEAGLRAKLVMPRDVYRARQEILGGAINWARKNPSGAEKVVYHGARKTQQLRYEFRNWAKLNRIENGDDVTEFGV